MTNIFQPSLFGSKEDFNPQRFKACIDDRILEDIIARAFDSAMEEYNEIALNTSLTYRTLSTVLHEVVFRKIKEISDTENVDGIKFSFNSAGNERWFFTYEGYAFIISKAGASKNDTKATDAINNQECGSHIISIVYSLSPFRDSVASLSFQYIKNGETLFRRPIRRQVTNNEVTLNSPNVGMPHVGLKKKKSREAI